jgi:hypothetical protein
VSLNLLALLALLVSAACSPKAPETEAVGAVPATATEAPAEVEEAEALQAPAPKIATATAASPTPTPLPLPQQFPTRYTLKVEYEHSGYALRVDQAVDYTNTTSEALANLVFMVEPNRYPGTFILEQLNWSDGTPVEDYRLIDNHLTIPLDPPLAIEEQVSLQMRYILYLPPIPEDSEEYKPVPFGFTQRQVNLVDWYLFLPPYRAGEGWLAHDPWFYGEHQVYDVADYDVEIEVGGTAEPLVLAASAQPTSREGNLYRYRMEQARGFAISLSPYYQVYSQQVGQTTVYSYGLPYYETGAQAALQYTVQALELFNQLFGAYPRPSLSVVVADFLDGMEYDGLYFLSRGFFNIYDGTPASYLTIIAVHETAHQWWYARVGNDQAYEPWLDEALCTYAERLYYEQEHPQLESWWWSFRVDFYEPSGVVGGSVYDYGGFRPYRDAVYLRGAQFLEALRQRVGDEAFFAFLRDYAAQKAGQQATAQDFFDILAQHSTRDISDLRQDYFAP